MPSAPILHVRPFAFQSLAYGSEHQHKKTKTKDEGALAFSLLPRVQVTHIHQYLHFFSRYRHFGLTPPLSVHL